MTPSITLVEGASLFDGPIVIAPRADRGVGAAEADEDAAPTERLLMPLFETVRGPMLGGCCLRDDAARNEPEAFEAIEGISAFVRHDPDDSEGVLTCVESSFPSSENQFPEAA